MSDGPGDFMGGIGGFMQMMSAPPEGTPNMSDERVIEILREAAAHAMAPCRFSPGDLVTPIDQAPLKGSGRPGVVIEVYDEKIHMVKGVNPSHSDFGSRLDMRVLHDVVYPDGSVHLVAHVVESWAYKSYTGPKVEIKLDITPGTKAN